jgi:hypothetical protein
MIDPDHERLSIRRQCELISILRATLAKPPNCLTRRDHLSGWRRRSCRVDWRRRGEDLLG